METIDWLCPSSMTSGSVFSNQARRLRFARFCRSCSSSLMFRLRAKSTERSCRTAGSLSEGPGWRSNGRPGATEPGSPGSNPQGSDEGSGFFQDSRAQGAEIAGGLGSQKEHELLRVFEPLRTTPSSHTCLFHVSALVNQGSGGGLVAARRNAATRT